MPLVHGKLVSMDFQPVFTALHHELAPRGIEPTSLTKTGTSLGMLVTPMRRLGAWGIATSSVRLFSDFREAPGMGSRAAGRAMQRLSQALCASNRVRVHVDSHLPKGPCVLVSNHQSYLDPTIVASLVPSLPITKADVIEWPVVGELARRYGALFVKPGAPASSYRVLRSALAHLEEGGTILNFPEGETTEGSVGRFRRGIFGVAALASVPVVPVAIAMGPKLMRKSDQSAVAHYMAVMKEGPHDVFLRFGKPLPDGPTPKLLARLARARIQLMLEELRAANGLSGVSGSPTWEPLPRARYVG